MKLLTILSIFFLFLAGASLKSQEALSLSTCFQLAEANHPTSRQAQLHGAILEARQSQLNRNYWPHLGMQGQATWQNEVTVVNIPLNIPGFEVPTPPREQFRVVAEVNQSIYDGGSTRLLKEAANAQQSASIQQSKSDLHRIRLQVHQLYFGILLQREQYQVLELVRSELNRRQQQLTELYQGGIVQRKDLDLLEVELLKHDQSITQNRIQEATLRENLGRLIGKEITADTPLQLPTESIGAEETRAEWALFDAQDAGLQAQADLVSSRRLPRLGVFAQGGLGQPGFNMFDPDPAPLFMAGARLQWNLGAFYLDSPDREVIRLNREVVRQQENAFRQGLDIQVTQASAQADAYSSFLDSDIEILAKRTRIKETATIQLEEGIITTPDYLKEVDAWYQANLNMNIHRIMAVQAAIETRLLAGKPQSK